MKRVGDNFKDKESKSIKLLNEQYKENIFHIRCHISNKVYIMIIDSGNCVNVGNTILVKKLNLNIVKHDKPYKFCWLNTCGEVMVTKHVLIYFLIEKYKDEVLCDVVHMHTSHLLLRRP